ncbi:hypothetical protein ACPM5D_005432 [Escherichia coli]
MMIQVRIFRPNGGKGSNCNDVRYGCLDGLRGHYDHSASDLNQNFSLKNGVGHGVSLVVTHRHDVRSPGCKLNYENFRSCE